MRALLLAASLVVPSVVPSVARAGDAPAPLPLCDAAAAMTKRTGTTFVVEKGVSCDGEVRMPSLSLPPDEAARRFVLAVVGRGHTVVETKGKATIGSAETPAWLSSALTSCPPPNVGKLGPLVHLRVSVDGKGAPVSTKIEATAHEQTPRGRCLVERAAAQKLAAVDGAPTTYSFPLAAPMRGGPMPAELKAKLEEIDREKKEHAARGAASQPAQGAHDGHAH